jgi:hypothetical protein
MKPGSFEEGVRKHGIYDWSREKRKIVPYRSGQCKMVQNDFFFFKLGTGNFLLIQGALMAILQLFLTGFKIGTLRLQGQAPYH